MRKGKALFTQTAMAAACTLCLIVFGASNSGAAGPEKTGSGAPSASIIFPVSTESAPTPATMKPVVFTHGIHEKAVAKCETCHHTGTPQSCTDCHTREGSKEGNFVTLDKAMHSRNIAPRKDGNTPTSCVSCHEEYIQSKTECAGCHNIVTPKRDARWCAVCHNAAVSSGDLVKGMKNKLPASMNAKLTDRAMKSGSGDEEEEGATNYGPTRCVIDSMSNEFGPNYFNHRRHVVSLLDKIANDKLAAAFHKGPGVICSTCHHHSPASMTPPKCGACHQKKIDPANPGRPNLEAAYHLQCNGCHKAMNVKRPLSTSCTTCHKRITEHDDPTGGPEELKAQAKAMK